ncbi:hypothetical protein VKT23_008421 [Stygiomarasmius scandens]|uniref:Uncharacterized protein n=1 Tax=Marasmiellus scandens TaxID=2682957 RepID=A0ABR1JMU1_9AGAR
MQLFISFLIGLALHSFAHSSNLGLVLLGAWEGICLHHLTSTSPSSYDPYLAYALRLCFDIFLTRNPSRVFFIFIWSLLINFATDALGDQHFYDTTHEKRARRTSTSEPTRERRRTSARRPVTSPSSSSVSATSIPSIPFSPPEIVSPIEIQTSTPNIRPFDQTVDIVDEPMPTDSTSAHLAIPPIADVSSIDDTTRPIPSLQAAAVQALSSEFVSDTFEPSLPVLAPRAMPSITDPLPPLNEGLAMRANVVDLGSPRDELQTPLLKGIPVDIADHMDELTTPPARSILLSAVGTTRDRDEESVTAVEQPVRKAAVPRHVQSAASGSNTPIPIPAPRLLSLQSILQERRV